jgi:hypothetical protein
VKHKNGEMAASKVPAIAPYLPNRFSALSHLLAIDGEHHCQLRRSRPQPGDTAVVTKRIGFVAVQGGMLQPLREVYCSGMPNR